MKDAVEPPWGSLSAKLEDQRAGALLWFALLIGTSLLLCFLLYRERSPGIVNEAAGIYRLPAALPELSGLARGRGEEIWGHNDSLDLPQLFALDRTGQLLSRYLLRDAEHVDWEDITSDHRGRLYLGDMGNNFHWRQRLTLYEVHPPSPLSRPEEQNERQDEQLSVSRRWVFCYPALPEGSSPLLRERSLQFQAPLTPLRCRAPLPPWESGARRYDSEALFWAPTDHSGGSLYLFDKPYLGGDSILYRLPLLLGEEDGESVSGAASPLPLQPVAVAEVGPPHPPTGARVTAADLSPDGRCLAVLSYHSISLFTWPPERPWRPVVTLPLTTLRLRQAEAVVWVESEVLWIGSEGLQRAELSGTCERRALSFGVSRGG